MLLNSSIIIAHAKADWTAGRIGLNLRFALNRTMNSGMCKFCTYLFSLQLTLFKDVVDMLRNHSAISSKQLAHLCLRQPYCLAIGLHFKTDIASTLVDYNLLFHKIVISRQAFAPWGMQGNTSCDESLVLYHLSSDSAYYTIFRFLTQSSATM